MTEGTSATACTSTPGTGGLNVLVIASVIDLKLSTVPQGFGAHTPRLT